MEDDAINHTHDADSIAQQRQPPNFITKTCRLFFLFGRDDAHHAKPDERNKDVGCWVMGMLITQHLSKETRYDAQFAKVEELEGRD